jgi:ubiquinone/menaquinone biosynthesis C-methylase UbiE
LLDQASTLADLLHSGIIYPAGSTVLEAGCGVGAQTIHLTKNNPYTRFTSVDISPLSLKTAGESLQKAGVKNVEFRTASIFDLPFKENSFDHVFVCFVLEHLKEPFTALENLKRVLKTGGTITVIEGDHGSAYYYPESMLAQKTINCLVELQASAGGNALIGRELYPVLIKAGFNNVKVMPHQVYCDSGRPEWVEGFTKKTFIAMVEGVKEEALKRKLIEPADWNQGIADLYETAGQYGTFNYTFFKATGFK